jgi:hypothetical protein
MKNLNYTLKSLNIKKDTYKLVENQNNIITLLKKHGYVLSRTTAINLLADLKSEYNIKSTLSLKKFTLYLTDIFKWFEEVSILMPDGHIAIRFVYLLEEVSPYEIALSLRPSAYFSHYSALVINDLTENNPKIIYINNEQTKKNVDKKNSVLTQKKVDYAFSKPMRRTNNIAKFNYKKIEYKVYMLNGKNTSKLGVTTKQPIGFSRPVKVTNIERTIIDTVVRPPYSGGVEEIANSFYNASDNISINKLIAYLRKIDYVYPYENAILFYSNKANYSDTKIRLINKYIAEKNNDINFYLDYQMVNKTLDSKSRVYYPEIMKKIKIEVNEIVVVLEEYEGALGVPIISDVSFYLDGESAENNRLNRLKNSLINIELDHFELQSNQEKEIRNILENEYNVDTSKIDIIVS